MTPRAPRGSAARSAAAAAVLLLGACAAPRTGLAPLPPEAPALPAAPAALPPIPPRDGPLRISVVHPPEGATLDVGDSTFVFGSVGTGGATLAIDGVPVEVAANGAFLAFLAVPADGVYRLRATLGEATATLERRVRRPAAAAAAALVDTATLSPRGAWTVRAGERVEVRFRGAPGSRARLLLPDGREVPLDARERVERPQGFMQDVGARAERFTEYAGSFAALPLRPLGDPPLPNLALLPPGTAGALLALEGASGNPLHLPLPLALAVLPPGEARAAVAASTRPDGEAIGVAVPGGGTPFHWSFPNGTRFTVDGEAGGMLRARLTGSLAVWIDAAQLRLEPAGAPLPVGTVGTVRAVPAAEWIDVRLRVTDRLPFEVRAEGRTLELRVFGARSRTNWVHFGPDDPLLRDLSWSQEGEDEYRLRVELSEPVWGWRVRWEEEDVLLLRVRRPPIVDPARPLAGIRVAVDAGHPPGGATGPTGLTEAEANLAIARALVPLLRAAGAEVLEIRPDTAAVALAERPRAAEAWDAHLLISVHNNAFPDGVDPARHAGTSTFYHRAPSLELARRMQRELVAELGLRDLGVARADLALVRPTWMPSVLTESMFLMVPIQEAALRDPEVQARIARAHLRALEGFLRDRAAQR